MGASLKLFLEPTLENCANGGIRRVVEAQHKYLPQFGIRFTQDPNEAEVTASHVTGEPLNPNAPFILHNHGMMWTDYNFPQWAERTNREIVASMRQAYTITSPSRWVTQAITRGVYFPVQTIYHGVDENEWEPPELHGNYILWNKARADEVSNPEDLRQLAKVMPEQEFWSTIQVDHASVRHLGILSNNQMKEIVRNAGLYLATARETFGIGTLEALSCGVPVVGWDYGGQSEIILNGETGYLAPYGDYGALADCVRRAFDQRHRLSRNARQDVQERWGWPDKIRQYADLYFRAAAWFSAPRPKVSVVIPAHNLAKYLPYAIHSVQRQTMTNFECLIVDDDSTDETSEIARAVVDLDIRFRYLKTHYNMGLSAVRNLGASGALGKYILYLDADDLLTERALEILSDALDKDRSIHVAYGSLELINEEATFRRRNRFPGGFNWYHQMAHQNQVPTAAMIRREVIERSGGWRTRQWRAEDAEFWSRVTSFGYQARKVTPDTTLLYRVRSDSKGSVEFRTYEDRDGNWLANIPWRSANSAQEGITYLDTYGDTVPRPELVPFGAAGEPPSPKFWPVYHYQEPLVTFIVYDGPYLEDTLDCIQGQYINQWEIYVVGEPIGGFPYVQFVKNVELVKPKGKVYELQTGEMLASDWLNIKLEIPIETDPFPTDKVLLQYMGNQSGRVPFRVNGKIYYGSRGKTEWVDYQDMAKLESRGKWKRVATNRFPEPQLADRRK